MSACAKAKQLGMYFWSSNFTMILFHFVEMVAIVASVLSLSMFFFAPVNDPSVVMAKLAITACFLCMAFINYVWALYTKHFFLKNDPCTIKYLNQWADDYKNRLGNYVYPAVALALLFVLARLAS